MNCHTYKLKILRFIDSPLGIVYSFILLQLPGEDWEAGERWPEAAGHPEAAGGEEASQTEVLSTVLQGRAAATAVQVQQLLGETRLAEQKFSAQFSRVEQLLQLYR